MDNFYKDALQKLKDAASGKFEAKSEEKKPADRYGYDVFDESGNRLGGASLKPGETINAGDKVYINSTTGEVVKNKEDALSPLGQPSISLNKDTGQIKLKAPEIAIRNENFKARYEEPLKIISQNFKTDKDYKYKMIDGEGEKNSEEWIEYFNNDLKDTAKVYASMEQEKDRIKNDTGLELTDEDMIKRNSVALQYDKRTGQTVKISDDTMQALPEKIKNLNAFKNIEGWDPDTHFVSYGDLMKSWNRGEIWEERASHDDFLDVYNEVEKYFSNGNFDDASEYAEMLAFRDFINGQSPDVGFFLGITDVVKDIGAALWSGGAEFDVGVLNFLEFGRNLERSALDKALKVAGLNIDAKLPSDFVMEKVLKVRADNFVDSYLRPEFDKWKEVYTRDEGRLNRGAASTYSVIETITPMAMQMAVGNAIGEAVSAGVAGAITNSLMKSVEGAVDFTKMISAVELANVSEDIIEGVFTASRIAQASGEMANSLYLGTSVIMNLSTAASVGRMVSGAINVLNAGRDAYKGITLANTAITAAGIAAETVIDVVMTDSHSFRKFMSSDSSDEDKAYIMEQIAGNALGWVGGVALTKGITGFSKTEVGRVANAYAIKTNKAVSAKIGNISDKIKTLLHGGDENWAFNKFQRAADKFKNSPSNATANAAHRAGRQAQVIGTGRVLRKAGETIAEKSVSGGARSWRELVDSADDFIRNAQDLTAEANLFANSIFKADTSALTAKFALDNPTFKSARNDYLNSLTKVLKAEDASGIKISSKKMGIVGGLDIRAMSKESNEYVNALYRLRQANIALPLTKDGNVVRGIQTEIEHCTGIIEKFEKNQPAELVEALGELEQAGRKLSSATQDVRVQFGVMEEAKLLEQRASGYFDEGYMRQQRAKTWDEYLQSGGKLKKGELRGQQNIEWGDTDEWQDMSVVLFDDINQAAKQVIRKRQTEALEKIGFKFEIAVDGDDVKVVRDLSPIRENATKKITQSAKKSVSEMSDDIFDKVVKEKKVGEALIKEAEGEVDKAGRSVVRRKAKELDAKPVGNKAVKDTIREIVPQEDCEAILYELYGGKELIDLDIEEFGEMTDMMSSRTKSRVTNQIKRILSDFREELPVSKKELPKIRTSSYRKATGNDFKNAPKELKRFLSEKNGVAMDDASIAEIMSQFGFGSGDFMDDDVLDVYSRVLAYKEPGLNHDDFREALKYDRDGDIAATLVYNNYADVWDDDTFFGDGSTIRSRATEQLSNKRIFEEETLYADRVKALEDIKAKYDIPSVDIDINRQMDEMFDDIIDTFSNDETIMKAIDMIDDSDDAAEYILLHEMQSKGMRKKLKDKFVSKAKDNYNKILTSGGYGVKTVKDEATGELKVVKDAKKAKKVEKLSNEWSKEAGDWFEEKLLQRYGEVQGRLAQKGSDLIDYKDYFGKVDAINKEIRGAMKAPDIVKTYSDAGVEEYIRLSPTIAGMMTMMPPALRRGPFGKVQQAFCKIFRLGTTGGIVPGSLTRQLFRDTQNALFVGNAWKSSREVEDILVRNFGSQIAETFQKEMPDVWETLLERAGGNVDMATRAAVEKEFARGATNVSSELESNLYDFYKQEKFARNADGTYDNSVFMGIKEKLNKVNDLMEKPNNMREEWLRNRVYRNALLDGMKEGKSLQEARRYAEFIQSEATTNFGRASYHLANLSETVPYLGSAINGTKSFWRLYSLDPVGITTRIVGGYVVPVIALTNMSMSTEENKRIYSQIKEYQKDDNLTFVVDGQIYQIPIPQEISNLVRPIQTMIENMYGTNKREFNELMLNDMLGFSPINLEGFLNVDADRMLEENLIEDHLQPGVMKMASSLMPPLVKSGFMYATGVDPYSGKKIDTSRVEIDPETGEKKVMSYNTGVVAEKMSELFGKYLSAPMAQAILKNLVGENFTYWGDFVVGLCESVTGEEPGAEALETLGTFAQNQITDVTDSLSITRYGEESNLAWNRAVATLYNKKDALVEEIAPDVKALQGTGLSDEARDKIKSRIETKKDEYREEVKTATENLIKNYGGTFDRNKFGAVISLMSFYDKETAQVNDDDYTSYLNKQEKSMATAAAYNTMERMGFPNTTDSSMFGYYDKEYGYTWQKPLSILNFEKTNQMQDEIHYANIKNIFSKKDDSGKSLYDYHKEFRDSLDPLYDAAASDKKVYNEIDKKIIEWDKRVMKEIAPYVSQMTADAALNNETVLDLVENMFEVPSAVEKDKKGRFFSLGKLGSKSDAFKRGLIKSLYGLNDDYKGRYDKINLDELVK